MNRKDIPKLTQALAFDLTWLKDRLGGFLWREDEMPGRIAHLKIVQKSESSKRITVLYDATISDRNGNARQQFFLGIIVPPEKYDDELKLIRKKEKVRPAFGNAITLIPEADLILLAFPNDRHMLLLSEKSLQNWLQAHLPEVANGALKGQSGQVTDAKIDILRYVPGKRYTVRCYAKILADSRKPAEITFIAKQLKNLKKAQKLYDNLRVLPIFWRKSDANQTGQTALQNAGELPVRIPRPLALNKEKGIVFLEDIPGENLIDSLPRINIPTIMSAAGEMLANFHCECQTVGKIITFHGELKSLRDSIELITKRLPHLRPRLKSFYEKMRARQPADAGINSLLHGTFRINHIFIHEQKLALLDLDSVCTGHPAYDIANFISALYYFEFQQRITAAQRKEITRYFLDGYSANAKWAIANEALFWHLANMLIKKQAHKYVKHLMQNRDEQVIRLINIAEKIVDKLDQPDAAHTTDATVELFS